jgi:hypothetical protein
MSAGVNHLRNLLYHTGLAKGLGRTVFNDWVYSMEEAESALYTYVVTAVYN